MEKEVYTRATQSTVEICFNNERVASHRRVKAPGRHTTVSEQMPPAHQKYLEWSPERFIHWAQKTGPHTAELVQVLLESRQHPQQAYRSCLGVLRLGSRYGEERLEAARRRALPAGIHSYKGVKNIPDTTIADAILDRLVHNAYRLTLKGESRRRTGSLLPMPTT